MAGQFAVKMKSIKQINTNNDATNENDDFVIATKISRVRFAFWNKSKSNFESDPFTLSKSQNYSSQKKSWFILK